MSQAAFLITVSMVIRNNGRTIEDFLRTLQQVVDANYSYCELLLVDNHSTDDSLKFIQQLQLHLPNLRLIRLSRIYSYEIALTAALDNSIGDYVVIIDPEQDSPEFIPEMVNRAQNGFDVVIAKRGGKKRFSPLGKWLVPVTYKLASRILGTQIEFDDTDFRLLSRRVVNALVKIRSKHRYLKYFNAFMGFSQSYITSTAVNASPTTYRTLDAISFAIDAVISNSAVPLRFATFVGLLASLINLLYFVYIILVALIKQHVVEGWITTSTMSTMMFLLLFTILTVLTEYITRILDETKDSPLYFVEFESSSIMPPFDREQLNVT